MMASDLFDLRGKVALVTGSSKGIGRAIARAMAGHGAEVVISSRKADACAEVAAAINAEVRAEGAGRAVAIPANISQKSELERLVAETRKQLGRIDILVCNAAVNPHYGAMSGLPDAAFEKILGVNIMSNHWLAQLVLPEMIARRDGSIVIVSSIGGLRGSGVLGAYCISKAADLQLVRNLAVEKRPTQRPRECDFARPYPNRFRACALGRSGDAGPPHRTRSFATHRRAGRNRRHRGLPRRARRLVHDRPEFRHRWRRDDFLITGSADARS